jgi:hypothetical protein
MILRCGNLSALNAIDNTEAVIRAVARALHTKRHPNGQVLWLRSGETKQARAIFFQNKSRQRRDKAKAGDVSPRRNDMAK